MVRKVIIIDNPALASLPFSAAVRAGKFLFVSGQIGIIPDSGALAEGGAAAETAQIIKNIALILAADGKDLADVVKANVYLTDYSDYGSMNAAYAEAFEKPWPARTCVGVAALPLGARVEIEVVAR